MRIPSKRFYIIAGFVLISAIFLYLRIKTLNHLLVWDEARNIIALRAFLSNNTADPFYWNYFFHPPLYMIFAAVLSPFKAGLDMRLELLSLLFSYATLVIVYMLGHRIGGRLYAFFSGLFLSLMPVSIAYDTWIKRDGLASALGYLAILLLLKKRFFWCAAALSFSLLAKESALFFIFAVTALLFALEESGALRKFALLCGVLFAMTSWWYICFSDMPRVVFDIYLSARNNAAMWAQPPWYYLGKLLQDLGPGLLIFCLAGISYAAYVVFRKGERIRAVPVIMALCVYIPSSIVIACKTPWLSISAAPALAMIAAGGALFLFEISKRSKLALTVFALLMALSVSVGLSFSYEKYHADVYPFGWNEAKSSRGLTLYLNERVQDGQAVMITEFSHWMTPISPVFLYYWKGGPVQIISGKSMAGDIIREIAKRNITWFAVVDAPDHRPGLGGLVGELMRSPLGKPAVIGWSYVWRAEGLLRENSSPPQVPI